MHGWKIAQQRSRMKKKQAKNQTAAVQPTCSVAPAPTPVPESRQKVQGRIKAEKSITS